MTGQSLLRELVNTHLSRSEFDVLLLKLDLYPAPASLCNYTNAQSPATAIFPFHLLLLPA